MSACKNILIDMFSLQLPVIVQYSYGHQVVQSQNVLERRKKKLPVA